MTTRKRILIVDDDHDTLDLLEIFLFRNYDVITAMNGFEALAKIEETMPSLILTDIKMPIMDGIRFFNSVRKNEKTKQIPVIAVTSFLQENTAKSLSNMGFNEVLPKPADSGLIAQTIARFLDPDSSPKKRSKKRRLDDS